MTYQKAKEDLHVTKLDEAKLNQLRSNFAYLVDPIEKAVQNVQKMPFFNWVDDLESPQGFGKAAVQLYYHSVTFPKVMGRMLGNTPNSENSMIPFYSEHAFTEATHHEMLMEWMLKFKILKKREEINRVIPTILTNSCINVAYQLAEERDMEKWIVTINSGIELCSNYFFKEVAPKMRSLGAGDEYFDIHVEADEFHSVMGLVHLDKDSHNPFRKKVLITKALEGISLWGSMIHSWIGLNFLPVFDLDGNVMNPHQIPSSYK